jgi:hypothetical protein
MTKSVVMSTWSIIKFNIAKGNTNYLREVTCQMISVLLWKHISDFLQVILQENNLMVVVNQLKEVGYKLDQYQERKRVILGIYDGYIGICTYLSIMEQNLPVLGKDAPTLLNVLIRLVIKNCTYRITENTT